MPHLDQLDRDLLALEQSPGSRDLLAGVFRTIHTIKGTCGFLAFNRLEHLTHAGESLLSRLRDGKIELTEARASALLRLVDAVRALLASIEATGAEGDVDVTALVTELSGLREDAPPAHGADAVPAQAGPPEVEAAPEPDPDETASPDEAPESPASFEPGDQAGPVPLGQMLVDAGIVTAEAVELARMEQVLGDPRPIGVILVEHGHVSAAAVAQALETQDARRSVVDSSVRVDVELLDSLMRLVGELVLARNQLVSRLGDVQDTSLARAAQRLSLVTGELQEQVMKTRMQPVDSVWAKLPRVVRDLAKHCGRRVRLELEGRETEVDRSVLEAIRDPLTHLVRNAVDHGIEPPDVRVAAGKSAEGVLRLRAYYEAGQVHLEIVDDGAGMDPARIGAKAVERGLVTRVQAARMSSGDLLQLIFLPGFSTAEQVTSVSGRGVGMDVVKTRIEGIGGSVEVTSTVGQGSTVRLTIPLTLAIIPALTIGCHGRRYALPQVSVVELVRLDGGHARGGIETVCGAPVYRLRDTLLPLVRLDVQLGLVPAEQAAGAPGGFVVVLDAEHQRFGLVVDDVLDTQEIVVKPLGRHLKALPVYSGVTILGDGTVVLILDAATLARRANVLRGGPLTTRAVVADVPPADPVLVVEVGGNRRAAIPLETVARLEELPSSAVERVGGREVVQYRGRIMPLVRLGGLLGAHAAGPTAGRPGEGSVKVVVHSRGERCVGIVVERILDIATERAGTRSDVAGHSLVGSVVVGDHVVELLDVQAAVLAADPRFFDAAAGTPTPEAAGR